MANCTICGEPMPDDTPFKFHGYDGNDCPKPPQRTEVVAVRSGIRRKRDGSIWFFVGEQEIECASMREAEAMLADLNAMLRQSGGSTHGPRAQ